MPDKLFYGLLVLVLILAIIYFRSFSKPPPPPKKEGEEGEGSTPTASSEKSSVWANLIKSNFAQKIPKVVIYAVGNGIFLWFWFFWLREFLILKYGINPNTVLLIITPCSIVATGIIYNIVLYHFGEKPQTWKSYTLISIFGTILIIIYIHCQPYPFFEHYPTDENGNLAVDSVGRPKMVSKFWIYRDKEGTIRDIGYSPGRSSVYGEPLVQGAPKDVLDAIKFVHGYRGGSVYGSNDINPKPVPNSGSGSNVYSSARPQFETIGQGTYEIDLASLEETNWKRIADGMYWDLAPAENADWEFIPFKGKVLVYRKGGDKHVSLPNQSAIFKIKSKEVKKTIKFILLVAPIS